MCRLSVMRTPTKPGSGYSSPYRVQRFRVPSGLYLRVERQQRNVHEELNDLPRTIVEDPAEGTSGTTYESWKGQTLGASSLPSSSINTSAKHRMSTVVPMRGVLDNVQGIPYE